MNRFYRLDIKDDLTVNYILNGKTYTFGRPEFEINGELRSKFYGSKLTHEQMKDAVTKESVYTANFEHGEISLTIRTNDNTPFIRYRYELRGSAGAKLTKHLGKDNLIYSKYACAEFKGTEVRLSEYNHQLYSFCMSETPAFRDGDSIMGPILVHEEESFSSLLAYEHGSQYPDRFIEFVKSPDEILIRAVKGNYYDGQEIDLSSIYETVWLQFGAVQAGQTEIARLYREFQQKHILPNHPSRDLLIFYNTWNSQERSQLNSGTYHNCMNLPHLLEDIDIAHRMGIDVYVIDTGWFTKCGDWKVRTDRFPDELASISSKLKSYGMKLGLWINPTAVALSSTVLKEHRDLIASYMGELTKPFDVWEAERSHGMCLSSGYWKILADTLIDLCKTKNVSYIKWDAIWQYGCTDGNHFHGTDKNSFEERGECYSFNMDRYLSKICDAILAECPDVILDFDITEEGRNVGLSWLSRGKYFLVNNGPNYHNYDLPDPQWTNMFVNPGPARTWICRPANNYDKWIPSNLFLCHYFPDPPVSSQLMNIGSLILGGNGIWGDLHILSTEDIELFGKILNCYKTVSQDIADSTILIDGMTATTLQKYEKINAKNGKGVIVLFGNCSRKNTLTISIESKCSDSFKIFGDAQITEKNGKHYISAAFDRASAVIIFFF